MTQQRHAAPGGRLRPVQVRWHRLVQHRIEQGVQGLVLAPVNLQPAGLCGMVCQPRSHLGTAPFIQLAIGIGLQFVLVHSQHRLAHFTTLNAGTAPPAMIWRRRSRPRDSRDITVPSGTSSTFATSS